MFQAYWSEIEWYKNDHLKKHMNKCKEIGRETQSRNDLLDDPVSGYQIDDYIYVLRKYLYLNHLN